MKKRERGKGKKAGWIYSAVCVGMLLAVGTGWLFLESRCKEIEKQTQEIDAGAVLQKRREKGSLKKKTDSVGGKRRSKDPTGETADGRGSPRTFGNGRYGRADPE